MKAYVASHLKDMNRKKVYHLLKEMDATSKAEISKLTGISAPTVIKIINFMVEQGLVLELGEGETAVGRKPHMLTLNTERMYVAAFVLEGDFFSAGIVDIRGRVIYETSMAAERDVSRFLDLIEEEQIERMFREAELPIEKLMGIGIALPVFYNKRTNTISGGVLLSAGTEINVSERTERLSEKYGVKVYIENDVNAQVLGEFQRAGMKGKEELFFISLGTGVGAGLILDGKLRRGAQYMCGEMGYVSYDENYRSDKREWGWLEMALGYHKLRERFGLTADIEKKELYIDRKEECVAYVAALLAKCINNATVLLDCANVVLGGRIVEILGQALIERVNEYLEHLSIIGVRVRMETAADVGLTGIASLAVEDLVETLLKKE